MTTTRVRIISAALGLAGLATIAGGLPALAGTIHEPIPATVPSAQVQTGRVHSDPGLTGAHALIPAMTGHGPGDPGVGAVLPTSADETTPTVVVLHDGVPELTLTALQAPIVQGMRVDPTTDDQDAAGTTLTGSVDGPGAQLTTQWLRTPTGQATLAATYQVSAPPAGTAPSSAQAEFAGDLVHVVAVVGNDPADHLSSAWVTGPTADRLRVQVVQGGAPGGTGTVAVGLDQL